MKVEEWYRGYFYYQVSQRIELIDGIYKYIVDGTHQYHIITDQECFDKNGVLLGNFRTKKPVDRIEKKIIEKEYNHFQLNYKFYKMPLGCPWKLDDIHDSIEVLEDSGIIKSVDQNDLDNEYVAFEYCKMGNTRHIANYTGIKILDLSIKEYVKNKDKVISEYPDDEGIINHIYRNNIIKLCSFFEVSESVLLRDNFDRKKPMISKLHKRITEKQKTGY